MKQYRIVKRSGEWHIVVEGQKCGILRCEERAPLVQTACRIAAGLNGSVAVYDPLNKLEARLTFNAGALSVDGRYDGDLTLAVPLPEPRTAAGHASPSVVARSPRAG